MKQYAILSIVLLAVVGITNADDTAKFSMDLMEPHISNPDIVYNENLNIVDALMIAKVKSAFATDPVEIASATSIWSATTGDVFIIPTNAAGAWSTHTKEIAVREESSWHYVEPFTGMRVLVDYDLVPGMSSGTRYTIPVYLDYSGSSWLIPQYSRTQSGFAAGKDEIYDSYTGMTYFGYPGVGGTYSGAQYKAFADTSGRIAIAFIKGVTPGDYYEKLFIVRDSNTKPVGVAGSNLLRFPYVGAQNNYGFKFGNLYLYKHLEQAAPDVNSVSDVVGGSGYVGILSVSNGADGFTTGDLIYTDTGGDISKLADVGGGYSGTVSAASTFTVVNGRITAVE